MNEFEFNPYINDEDMLKVCKENNIVVQAYGPVGSGTTNTFVGGAQDGVATHGTLRWNFIDYNFYNINKQIRCNLST